MLDDVAGHAAEPIAFPRASNIKKCRRVDYVRCVDVQTQNVFSLSSVLMCDDGGDAYWHRKELSKTLTGNIEIYVVLKRIEFDTVQFRFTDDYVAIKASDVTQENIQMQNPFTEIAAIQLLQTEPAHRNLIRCVDVLSEEGPKGSQRINIILPYFKNGDLVTLVGDGGLSENTARLYFRQIVSGLSHMHNKLGICHRDISPENIMVDGERCIIIDLGLCLRMPHRDGPRGRQLQLIKPQGQIGKRCYMPPEIFLNKCAFDGCAADIWMAGTTLFYMLTGERPYDQPTTDDTCYEHLTGNLRFMLGFYNETLSENVIDLLQKIFQVDPALRLSIKDIQEHDWYKGPGGSD